MCPFAATPVAIATFAVCNPSDLTENIVTCDHILPGHASHPHAGGRDLHLGLTSVSVRPIRISRSAAGVERLPAHPGQRRSPSPTAAALGWLRRLSPSAENTALMALIDSDPTAKADCSTTPWPTRPIPQRTTTDTPNETVAVPPCSTPTSVVTRACSARSSPSIATTNAPSILDSWGALGTGRRRGARRLPGLGGVDGGARGDAVERSHGGHRERRTDEFVGAHRTAPRPRPRAGSGITLDPATNLVTFNSQPTDATAYNNYLMVESYLVVPTTGLAADKATKLAQFIRFILGPTGQSDISGPGRGPGHAGRGHGGTEGGVRARRRSDHRQPRRGRAPGRPRPRRARRPPALGPRRRPPERRSPRGQRTPAPTTRRPAARRGGRSPFPAAVAGADWSPWRPAMAVRRKMRTWAGRASPRPAVAVDNARPPRRHRRRAGVVGPAPRRVRATHGRPGMRMQASMRASRRQRLVRAPEGPREGVAGDGPG